MATDATLLAHGGWGPRTGTSQTTSSVSPTANAHLVVFVCGNTADGVSDDSWSGATISGGGLTWTPVNASPNAAFTGGAGVYTAQCGASPGTFAMTWDMANDFDAAIWAVWEVTGGASVTGATCQANQAGNGAVDLVLGATPASGDCVLVMSWVDNSSPAGAVLSGTWQDEHDYSTDEGQVYGGGNTAWRNDTTTATQSWSDVNTGSSTFTSSQAGVIITGTAGGDGTATPAAIAVTAALPAATADGDDLPYVVTSNGAALSTDDPSVTFSGYTPLENDLVILFPSSATVLGVVANASLPAGWTNPLGDGVEVNSDAHGIACLWHLVTAAEQTGGTTTYTATNALDAAETGYTHGVVVRFVNTSAPIDGFNSASDSSNTVTPHVLAGITGSGVLIDGSLVVSSVAKDGTGAYSSTPGGWTQLQATNTNQGRWTGTRDARTTLNTDVTATNITPSAGDEYASITLAIAKPAAAVGGTATPAATAVTVAVPAATRQGGGAASPAAIAAVVGFDTASVDSSVTLDAPVAVAVAVPQVSTGVAGTGSPAAVATLVDLPAVTTQAGAASSPSAIDVPVTIPAATTQAGGTASPAALAVVVDMPAVTATGGGSASASPSAISVTALLPAVTTAAGATATPDAIPVSVTLPAASATGSTQGTATPAAITVTVTLPAVTTAAGATATPDAIPVSVTLPAASATGSTQGTATPAAITVTVTLPAVTTAAGATATPDPISLAVTLPAATAQASHTATPATITTVVTVPAVTTQAGAAGSPATIAATVTIPQATLLYGSVVSPAAIAVAVALGAVIASGLIPDAHPITVTVRDRGHTVTVTDARRHTATVRAKGHTATAREQR